jgi:uncharacterized protein (TIGR04222 family)
MNFLFDNPLANMLGPIFLLIYGTLIVVSAMLFYFFKSSFDWTSKQPTPLIPTTPDPFEIAYLRGGINEFARALVFSLTQKGFLEIINSGKKSYISLAKNQPNWTILSQMERDVLGWFQTTRETSEVFDKYGFIEIIQPFSVTYEQKIKQNHLLIPNDVKTKTKLFSYLIFTVIAILGGYKLTASIVHGKYNILFLMLFILVALVTFWFLSKTQRLSQVGLRYIESMQNAFEKLRDNPTIAKQYYSQSLPALNAVDPLLLAMGIYGTSVLVGNGYSHFEQAFERVNKNQNGFTSFYHSSCSSGCGSSCSSWSGSSSCSSSESGSTCSSGSSCGGGSCGGGCGGS